MIETILLTTTVLLGLGGLSYFYGNPDGPGVIDRFHRGLFIFIPRLLVLILNKVLGRKYSRTVMVAIDDFFTKRNPIVLYLYLILTFGGYSLFVLYGYSELPNPVVPWEYHKHVGFVLFFVTVTLFIKASTDDPGIITKSNLRFYMKSFRPDGLLFPDDPTNICRTCTTVKPARSKHCSTCNRCIARFDHHCVWINQCVGIGNVKPFLLFLLANNALCLYGSYLGCGVIENLIEDLGLSNAVFRDRNTGEIYKASWYYIVVYLIGNHKPIVFLTIFCTIMGVFLLWFSWYHWVTLMRCGLTTNEEIKLGRMKTDKAGTKFNQGSWWRNCRDVFTSTTFRNS